MPAAFAAGHGWFTAAAGEKSANAQSAPGFYRWPVAFR